MSFSRLSRLTAAFLISALLSNNFALAAKKPVDPAAMLAKVQARGVGHRVRVNMTDNTETKGVIVNIGEQSFSVMPKGAAQPREIQYAQVTGVHNDEMGTGTKVLIVVAVAAAGIIIGAVVVLSSIHKSLSSV